MEPISVELLNISYERPGITKLHFIADYGLYKRKGVIKFDVNKYHFITHTRDLGLLRAACEKLQKAVKTTN